MLLSSLIALSVFVYSERLYRVAQIALLNCWVITALLLICWFHNAATNLLERLLEAQTLLDLAHVPV